MREEISALLVHQNSATLRELKYALERQGVRVIQAGSRRQAKLNLNGLNPAPLVFTDTQVPDGTWVDILALTQEAALPVNLIVVARVVDTRFYVEVIEAGAFDFIAPPFNAMDLAYVLRTASDNVQARRAVRPHTSPSAHGAFLSEAQEAETHVTTG
jgi:DNA-binding NtrC family response regulator